MARGRVTVPRWGVHPNESEGNRSDIPNVCVFGSVPFTYSELLVSANYRPDLERHRQVCEVIASERPYPVFEQAPRINWQF